MEEINFNKISIIGLGLMGGSLGLAIKKNIKNAEVIGISRKKENVKYAKKIGAIDDGTNNLKEGVKNSDLVVIATLVDAIVPTFKKIAPHLKNSCIVTDIGSTKLGIVQEINNFLTSHSSYRLSFIGGHPMCGREVSGIKFAKDDLYENAVYILTPYNNSSREISKLKSFIYQIKAKPYILSPHFHDYCVAGISHLPYIVAVSLAKTIDNLKDKNKVLKFAAGGFRDTTRIAASSPQMWKDICFHNKKEILKFLSLFVEEISHTKNLIEEEKWDSIEKKFASAKKVREKLNRR